jgi:hypothetical protein
LPLLPKPYQPERLVSLVLELLSDAAEQES